MIQAGDLVPGSGIALDVKVRDRIDAGGRAEHEMEEEHPLELERIKSDRVPTPDPAAIARRGRVFMPVAGIVGVLLLAGLYWFVTFEQTAITTLPPK